MTRLLSEYVSRYFATAREREAIRVKKEVCGLYPPWTKDKIFQRYRFCCVNREDDKVTRWARYGFRSFSYITVFACVAFRYFNRIDTGKILVDQDLLFDWNPATARKALRRQKPLINAAYIINTSGSPGKSKLEGIIDILQPIWKAQEKGELNFKDWELKDAHTELMRFPYCGSFMAYEAVCDLYHTPILEGASDIMSWAALGPGAARGLSRMTGQPLKTFHYGNPKGQRDMLPLLRELLEKSRDNKYWPQDSFSWDARTAEHWLCEWDKHERVRCGQGEPKQRYPGV